MSIIVEDGSIVSSANSYLSISDCNNILYDFGYDELPVGKEEPYIKQACIYIDSFRAKFKGCKSNIDQSLQFPRYDLIIDGILQDSDVIPQCVKIAQALAANELRNGNNLYSTNKTGQQILSKTVDVVSITYSETGVANPAPIFGQIMTQLNPVLKGSGGLVACRV